MGVLVGRFGKLYAKRLVIRGGGSVEQNLHVLGNLIVDGTSPTSAVVSVNGAIGAVVLTATDVGALASTVAASKVAAYGTATLVGGTVTIANALVAANSVIIVSAQALGTVAVATALAVTARSVGVSFTVTSANVIDTSTVAWLVINP